MPAHAPVFTSEKLAEPTALAQTWTAAPSYRAQLQQWGPWSPGVSQHLPRQLVRRAGVAGRAVALNRGNYDPGEWLTVAVSSITSQFRPHPRVLTQVGRMSSSDHCLRAGNTLGHSSPARHLRGCKARITVIAARHWKRRCAVGNA